jgi:predicted Zn-dependent peptidase
LYKKFVLDNGLRIITNELPYINSVSIVFFISAGSYYESDQEAGISHFIEHLCFRGTKSRLNSREISQEVENKGGILNGGTDKELTVFWCKIASQHLTLAFNVLCDLIRNSRFDINDINIERQIIAEEINMSLDSPQQRVDMLMDELLWPDHPLGRDCAGKKEVVASLTRNQILNFYKGHYLPNNTVISIAGNIDSMKVANVIRINLADWKPEDNAYYLPETRTQGTSSKIYIEKRNSEQVNICLGIHGLSRSHPDRFAADLISVILGEGMSSRLFVELRENQGLVYDIGSCVIHYTTTGSFVIAAGVAPSKLNNAIVSILGQLSKIKDDISPSELEIAKEMAKGRLLLALEDSRTVANWYGAQEILSNTILDVNDVIDKIDSVKLEDVKRVLAQYFTTEELHLAVVGPVSGGEKSFCDILRL